MRPIRQAVMLCAAGVSTALWVPFAGAQSAPDPADPAARVPPASYQSTFSGYRPMKDEPLAGWRESNDEVGRIGGWRAYAREAQAPEGKPDSPPAKVVPAPGGHGMHGKPGGKQ